MSASTYGASRSDFGRCPMCIFLKHMNLEHGLGISSHDINTLLFGQFIGSNPLGGQTFSSYCEIACSVFALPQFRVDEVFQDYAPALGPILDALLQSFACEKQGRIQESYSAFAAICPLSARILEHLARG